LDPAPNDADRLAAEEPPGDLPVYINRSGRHLVIHARPRSQRAGRPGHTARTITRTIADLVVQIRAAHSAHHQWF
jgi:hypothetical protein